MVARRLAVKPAMNPFSSIAVDQVTCDFPGVRALDSLSLEFHTGEIHALAGENGAGKSTLLKVLSGLVAPTQGQILIGDQRLLRINHPWPLGIRTIPQEPVLAPDLSLAENLLMGRLPKKSFGRVDWPRALETSRTLLTKVGLDHLSPQRPMAGLGVAEQQLIEIARALASEGTVYLFDEPTSSLSSAEVAKLSEIVQELRRSGRIVVYASHRLDEIFSFCDRVSILRDGRLVASQLVSQTSPKEVIRLMVGRAIAGLGHRSGRPSAEAYLTVKGLTVSGLLNDVSFEVHRGEILGIGGLVGAGRTELLQTIFGVHRHQAGSISLDRVPLSIRSPRDAIAAGIVYLPEDRKLHGLALQLSVAENFGLPNLKELSTFGFLQRRKRSQLAKSYTERLHVRYRRLKELALLLSGGNQQKIVLGKWLARNPSVLLLDEPTRGIDIGAKSEIYSLIRKLASEGTSIVLVSSELPELLALSDRVIVMREGELAGEVVGEAITEEAIMQLAMPGFRNVNGAGAS
ncbi:MAG: sugar ABC transporter ATP-binding protein [Acidobacteria bacterium]|nr:sugar ABC transporter ATP-binding protein [Acidobacteriota bacterium]MCI0620377.1 sugar ABC transporter ATP-binding protein [Acidobacteriota bacterium]MCI0724130.1 sugar ABC transporter ATP-binding protein [Acidobacteriota bacterium]